MTDKHRSDPETEVPTTNEEPFGATAVSSTYKTLGEFDADSGAGVLGRNTADSSTPIGVEGTVPNNSSGYGLSTPDDARVAGTAELAVLSGALTGEQETTDLLGAALTADSGTLTATKARIDVDDGSTTVSNVEAISFEGLTVSDDGDGSATIDR